MACAVANDLHDRLHEVVSAYLKNIGFIVNPNRVRPSGSLPLILQIARQTLRAMV